MTGVLDGRWAAATLVALVACVIDVKRRRIPNLLTFGAAAAGLLYHTLSGGSSGLFIGAAGWATGIAVFLPLYLLRGLAAGDVKLLGALGAWIGAFEVVWVAVYTAIAGGIMAIAISAWHGQLRQSVGNVGFMLWYWQHAGVKPVPGLTLDRPSRLRLPYAVPILCGVMARAWLSV